MNIHQAILWLNERSSNGVEFSYRFDPESTNPKGDVILAMKGDPQNDGLFYAFSRPSDEWQVEGFDGLAMILPKIDSILAKMEEEVKAADMQELTEKAKENRAKRKRRRKS